MTAIELTPEQMTMAKKLGMEPEQMAHVIRCARDRYGAAMPSFLRVRDKSGTLVPVHPTRIHLKFKKHQRRINFVLKPRQVYFTTFMEADNYLECVEGKGHRVLFVNLDNRVTEEVFDRVHNFEKEFTLKQLLPKPERNTTRKLSWKNGSSFDAITIKNDDSEEAAKTLGRSCTQQSLHGTECAYWRHYRVFTGGAFDSVPRNGSITLETTGNGAQGGFYEDFTEVMEKGTLVAPNVWVLGDKAAHFFAWWEHPEYCMADDPIGAFAITKQEMDILLESEAEHRREMQKDPDLSGDFIAQALNWRRWMLLNKKGFLRDPQGAIAAMDREYPGNARHGFASTGSAFLNLGLTDARREEWKRYNAEHRLPLFCRMAHVQGSYSPWPGSDEVMIWVPPYNAEREQWEDRYLVGGDVGGGNPDSDPDSIWVKDRFRNMYVAASHGKWGPAKWAEIAMALAYYYHRAQLVWERNNHGIGVSIKVHEAQYPNVYRHDDRDTSYQSMGFLTTESSRAHALSLLKAAYEDRQKPWLMPYVAFYTEAAAFRPPANRPNGKPEGQGGVHDDLVMGAAVIEAVDAMLAPPRQVEIPLVYQPGTIGSIREMAMGNHGGGIGNIL